MEDGEKRKHLPSIWLFEWLFWPLDGSPELNSTDEIHDLFDINVEFILFILHY